MIYIKKPFQHICSLYLLLVPLSISVLLLTLWTRERFIAHNTAQLKTILLGDLLHFDRLIQLHYLLLVLPSIKVLLLTLRSRESHIADIATEQLELTSYTITIIGLFRVTGTSHVLLVGHRSVKFYVAYLALIQFVFFWFWFWILGNSEACHQLSTPSY